MPTWVTLNYKKLKQFSGNCIFLIFCNLFLFYSPKIVPAHLSPLKLRAMIEHYIGLLYELKRNNKALLTINNGVLKWKSWAIFFYHEKIHD